MISVDCAPSSAGVCTRISPLPSSWTIVSPDTTLVVAVRASSTEHCAFGTRNSAPPRNSMPKFRPRNTSASTATSRISPEMAYQSRLRPTKLKEVLPV